MRKAKTTKAAALLLKTLLIKRAQLDREFKLVADYYGISPEKLREYYNRMKAGRFDIFGAAKDLGISPVDLARAFEWLEIKEEEYKQQKKIAKVKIAKALLRKVAHLKTAQPLQQRNQSDLTVKLPPRYPTYEESRASVELPFMTPGLPRGVSQAVIRPGDVFQPIYAVRTLTPETGSNTFVPGRNQAPLQIPPPKPLSTREQLIRLGDILDRELERLQRFRRDMKFDEMPWNRGRRRGDTDLSAFRFANDVQPQPEAQPPLGPFFEDQEPTQPPFEVEPPAGYFLEGPDEEQEAFDTDSEAQQMWAL